MKAITLFIIQIFFITSSFADRNEEEPRQMASLKINGAMHSVVVGQESELTINNQPYQVVLELDPIRNFSKKGISFDYSSEKNFAYQSLSSIADHWELSGSNSAIMVQNYPGKTSRNDIYKAFLDEYALMKAELDTKDITLHSNGNAFEGKRLRIDMGNAHLMQDVFVFENKNSTLVLILQDNVNEDGSNTKEYIDTTDLIRDTLRIEG